jgi:hypothetical protein
VIPGEPNQTVTVRIQAGCRIEVVPARKNARRLYPRDVYANESVDDFTRKRMVFLYANYATAPPVDGAICISKRIRPRRRDRAQLLPNILPIQPLINEVGEVNDTILHNK